MQALEDAKWWVPKQHGGDCWPSTLTDNDTENFRAAAASSKKLVLPPISCASFCASWKPRGQENRWLRRDRFFPITLPERTAAPRPGHSLAQGREDPAKQQIMASVAKSRSLKPHLGRILIACGCLMMIAVADCRWWWWWYDDMERMGLRIGFGVGALQFRSFGRWMMMN